MLSALEHPAESWQRDPEGARASISAAITLVLRLIGRDPDAARSRDHALLSVLVERRMQLGLPSSERLVARLVGAATSSRRLTADR